LQNKKVGGSGIVTDTTQVCQGAEAAAIENSIKDGACLKSWLCIKARRRVPKNLTVAAQRARQQKMKRISFCYAIIHVILLVSSVQCDGTYKIVFFFMRSLRNAQN
jgi:hypothetical protein